MANFIQKTLEPGETVVYQGRLHWSYNWENLFGGIALLVAGMVALACDAIFYSHDSDTTTFGISIICLVLMLVGVALILWSHFIRSKTEFAITNTRFIQKDGIFNIKMTEIPLFKVETVNFYQSFFQRILNTGTIELVGSGGTGHTVSYVKQPYKVRNLLTTYMKENRQTNE